MARVRAEGKVRTYEKHVRSPRRHGLAPLRRAGCCEGGKKSALGSCRKDGPLAYFSCPIAPTEAFIAAWQCGGTGPSRGTSIQTLRRHFNCASEISRSPTSRGIRLTFTVP